MANEVAEIDTHEKEIQSTLTDEQLKLLAEIQEEQSILEKKQTQEKTRIDHEQSSSWDQRKVIPSYEADLFGVTTSTLKNEPTLNDDRKLVEGIESKPLFNKKDIEDCQNALVRGKRSVEDDNKNPVQPIDKLDQEIQVKFKDLNQTGLEAINSLKEIGDVLENIENEKTENKPPLEKVNLCEKLLNEVGIPKLQDMDRELKELADFVEEKNQQREDILNLQNELSNGPDSKDSTYTLSDRALEKIASLEESGIELLKLDPEQKEISIVQYTELKAQIKDVMSNLQIKQQTTMTTKINPLLTEKNVLLETLKTILRIWTRLVDTLVQNQKVN